MSDIIYCCMLCILCGILRAGDVGVRNGIGCVVVEGYGSGSGVLGGV